jgi:sugar/nucleoside kinase (ribokinase family)
MAVAGFDVVVVGNVGIDTNVYSHSGDIDFNIESSFTENIDYVGQAGGYASRGYAQLGRRTAFIGHVGDDFSGRYIREELARDGIDTRGLFVDPNGTARSINLVYSDGRRKSFYDGKGHMHLQPDVELCRTVLAGSKLAHFHIPNWARLLLPAARELGLVIACDIQDVVSAADAYRRDFVEHADILFFSAANQANPSSLVRIFLGINLDQIVIAGLGARGCAVGTREGIHFYPAVEMEEPVVDTNGAGDGLAVGFLSSFVLDGYSLGDSVLRGQIAARYTCSQKASSSCLITPDRLESHFRALSLSRT